MRSHSYDELDQIYHEHWQYMTTAGNLPTHIPMTSGWDKRPWGGSADPLHDDSWSTPDEFQVHLQAAKDFMDSSQGSPKIGVICCWNEYGEGSYIEPTKAEGFSYLEKIREVFGP